MPMNLQGIEVDDIRKSTLGYIRKHYLPWTIIYFVFVAATIWLVCISGIVQLLIIDIIIGTVGYGYVYSKIETEFIKEFGAAIGYEYSPNAPMESVSGRLFQTGDSHNIIDVLSGVYQNIPLRIYTYKTTIGEGKSRHTYSIRVFEATFQNNIPEVLLNYNDDIGSFIGLEKLKFESNEFNKLFAVYVPKGGEMEAYEIFTPDVMADILDKTVFKRSYLNFEFSQNKLYIYTDETINTKADMQKAFDLTDYILNLFKKNISEASDSV